MDKERAAFDQLMSLLDQVVNRMGTAHSPANDFGTGVPLYRAEIHTIQSIGQNPGINMTELARLMNVTKGAISQTVNKLERKELVRKTRIGTDNREVVLLLTDLGWNGYHNHEKYHAQTYNIVRQYFGDKFKSKLKTHTTVMNELNEIMDLMEKQSKNA